MGSCCTSKSGWIPNVYYTTLYSITRFYTILIFMQVFQEPIGHRLLCEFIGRIFEKSGEIRVRRSVHGKELNTGVSTEVQWLGLSTVIEVSNLLSSLLIKLCSPRTLVNTYEVERSCTWTLVMICPCHRWKWLCLPHPLSCTFLYTFVVNVYLGFEWIFFSRVR